MFLTCIASQQKDIKKDISMLFHSSFSGETDALRHPVRYIKQNQISRLTEKGGIQLYSKYTKKELDIKGHFI